MKPTNEEMPTGEVSENRQHRETDEDGEMPSGNMSNDEDRAGGATDREEMPTGGMGERGTDQESGTETEERQEMPSGGMEGEESDDIERVLIEMNVGQVESMDAASIASKLDISGLNLDEDYIETVPPRDEDVAELNSESGEVVLLRGRVKKSERANLENQPGVIEVFDDLDIEPFESGSLQQQETLLEEQRASLTTEHQHEEHTFVQPVSVGAFGTCPIQPCDCDPRTPKGTIADVARYLGVDKIWEDGIKGQGIVVGVVDGGITAQQKGGEIGNVVGGWPTDSWGTKADWGRHGNMCATDTLGMAPDSNLYDIRLTDNGAVLSNAIAGFRWAIDQHRSDGTPHILTNSWGYFSGDSDYSRNPNHPFTRLVQQAIDEGILVLFAAGNCGEACSDSRCGTDTGPAKSIWGANGHPRVITVGAANTNEQFIGYSSQGPAALDPRKPDFCSISHFTGYTHSDAGTSAATPIAAGVVALLKQADSELSQDEAKSQLMAKAKDIGPEGWDQHSGAGIIQAKSTYDSISRGKWSHWEGLGGTCLHGVGASSWAENRLDTFVIGTDSQLWHKWWDGSAWQGWEPLGGVCISEPAAVSWGNNRIDTFVIGTDNQLWHKWWDGSAWQGWEPLGGTCIQGVAASSQRENQLDVFVVGTDNGLYQKTWDGSTWSGWKGLGGICISAPESISWGNDRIDTFVIGTDNQLWHKWWDG